MSSSLPSKVLLSFFIISTLFFVLRDESVHVYYQSWTGQSGPPGAISTNSEAFFAQESEIAFVRLINNDTVPRNVVMCEERDAYKDFETGLWGVKLKDFEECPILSLVRDNFSNMTYYWRNDTNCPSNATSTLKNKLLSHKCVNKVKSMFYKLGYKQYLYTYNKPLFINHTEVVTTFCDFELERKLVQNIEKPYVEHRQTQIHRHPEDLKMTDKLSINVLMIDGMSRPQFIRGLKKSSQLLEDVHNRRSEYGFEVFQFLRYNVVGRGSISNLTPMTSGKLLEKDYTKSWGDENDNYTEFDHDYWLWKHASKNGYVTLFSDEQCGAKRHLVPWMAARKDGGINQVDPWVDHRFGGIFCEMPNVQYGSRKRCINGNQAHNYVFEYLNSFFGNYQSSPKFAWNILYEAHEQTYSILPLMDDDLVAFLTESMKDPTRVTVILSDHGLHYGPFTYFPYPGILEHKFPTLLMLFPDHFLKRHPSVEKALKEKEQAVITPPDIYSMLLHLMYWPNKPTTDVPPKIRNLLKPGSLPEYRSCKDANIPAAFCVCDPNVWLDAEGTAAYGE